MIYFIDTTYKDNSLKFKSLAFWRKNTPFIDQKCTYEKVPKIGQGLPPPLIRTKSKRTAVFIMVRKNQKIDLQSQYHNGVI